jgi:hypothetical protein
MGIPLANEPDVFLEDPFDRTGYASYSSEEA